MTQNVADCLRTFAQSDPDRIAIRFPQSPRKAAWDEVSFGEIDRQADILARGFIHEGLQGKRVLLAVKPGLAFYAISFGLLRAGAVPVFLDPGMKRSMMLDCVQRLGPEALIGTPAACLARYVLRKPFRSVRKTLTLGRPTFGSTSILALHRAFEHDDSALPEVRATDDAVFVFTSGSTGRAKPVALTHATMLARIHDIQHELGLKSGQVVVETLLVYTVLEMSMGMSVVVPPMDVAKPATVDPDRLIDTILAFQPHLLSASPVVWQRLVRSKRAHDLRVPMLLTTAAPIPVDLHTKLRGIFGTNTQLFTPYGATESMPIAIIGSQLILDETAARTQAGEGVCVGRIAALTQVRIAPITEGPIARASDVPDVPEGTVGEIWVRGGGTSPRYAGEDDANALSKVPDDGGAWHRMGDLGWIDERGRLWFSGRVGHALYTAQGLVPAIHVEGVFNADPNVYRCALIGVGPKGAQQAWLVVELEALAQPSEATSAQILARATGSRWEGLVKGVLFHPSLPVDTRHNSKIRREDLRSWVVTQTQRRLGVGK